MIYVLLFLMALMMLISGSAVYYMIKQYRAKVGEKYITNVIAQCSVFVYAFGVGAYAMFLLARGIVSNHL